MKKISADWVYPVSSPPIEKGVLIVDDQTGQINAIGIRSDYSESEIEVYKGILVPGFINTHCHLELSHMKGKVNTGTTLLPFLQRVVAFRDFPQAVIDQAIDAADKEMYENGIVAVGDISNKLDTAHRKDESLIRYYTFVEMFDFLQEAGAESTYQNYRPVYEGQSTAHGNRKSAVPHAPYTVSKALFKKIKKTNPDNCTISIHNQETPHENALFKSKTGDFIDFFKGFNVSLENFNADGRTSIHYALENMNPNNKVLFVHNTMTNKADIEAAHAWSDNCYWASCPNANLYIENRLPNYKNFLETNAKVTLGTDSLTSNWQLSILEEMKTIARYQSYISFDILLKWATLNGAQALGFDADFGSFEVGKCPGINLLSNMKIQDTPSLNANTKVQRLV